MRTKVPRAATCVHYVSRFPRSTERSLGGALEPGTPAGSRSTDRIRHMAEGNRLGGSVEVVHCRTGGEQKLANARHEMPDGVASRHNGPHVHGRPVHLGELFERGEEDDGFVEELRVGPNLN